MKATTMSLDVELALFADQIPFLAERNYRELKDKEIKNGSMPEPINDVWTALALLIKRHNDQTARVVMTSRCEENQHGRAIIRIRICDGRYSPIATGFVDHHDFPVTESVVEKLIDMNYVEWLPLRNWPDRDSTKLKLTENGQAALVEYLEGL